jgi:hypothetical protein
VTCQAVFLLQKRFEQMYTFHSLVLMVARYVKSLLNGFLCPDGKIVQIHFFMVFASQDHEQFTGHGLDSSEIMPN